MHPRWGGLNRDELDERFERRQFDVACRARLASLRRERQEGHSLERELDGDLDHIRTAILALQLYAEGNHDDQELATVNSCITNLQKMLASHAKNADAAMGVTPALKHVRRVSRGAGY